MIDPARTKVDEGGRRVVRSGNWGGKGHVSGGSSSSIEGLVDATFAAAARDDWQAVIDHCAQVLELEPEHDTALRFTALAQTRLATGGAEEPAQRDERRQLTVMFADIVESTAMTQVLEPDQMRTILKRYQMVCSDAIAEWDGFIGKWTGDGLMAYFGFPIPHEDSAYRAAMAGLTMLDRLDAFTRSMAVLRMLVRAVTVTLESSRAPRICPYPQSVDSPCTIGAVG